MDIQSRFEKFLNPGKQKVLGFPIPQFTTALAQRLVKQISNNQRIRLINLCHVHLRIPISINRDGRGDWIYPVLIQNADRARISKLNLHKKIA